MKWNKKYFFQNRLSHWEIISSVITTESDSDFHSSSIITFLIVISFGSIIWIGYLTLESEENLSRSNWIHPTRWFFSAGLMIFKPECGADCDELSSIFSVSTKWWWKWTSVEERERFSKNGSGWSSYQCKLIQIWQGLPFLMT